MVRDQSRAQVVREEINSGGGMMCYRRASDRCLSNGNKRAMTHAFGLENDKRTFSGARVRAGSVSHVPLAATKIVARKIMTGAARPRERSAPSRNAKLSRIW